MRKFRTFGIAGMLIAFWGCTMPSSKHNEKITDPVSETGKDTFQLLCQYWELTDADNPSSKDVPFKERGIEYQSGMVFLTDSSFLENPAGERSYGKFVLRGDSIYAAFQKGPRALYLITRLNKDELHLSRVIDKKVSGLTYKATHTSWPDAAKNPFSEQNYQWSVKPQRPESESQIRKRVKESVQFYAYYFEGFLRGGSPEIDFKGLPCCLNWYAGGITIQSEGKLDKKWEDCFYSQEQAFQGRQILEDVLVKKYNWDEKETNWIKQTTPVLRQILENLKS